MNDDTDDELINLYSIERLTLVLDHCEHADLECTDLSANADDMILLPDTFLKVTGTCSEYATHRLIVADEWCRAMGCDEPDEYLYCATHAQEMLTSLDPDALMP